MKKLLSLLLAIAMMLSLAACGGAAASTPEAAGSAAATAENSAEAPASEAAPADAPADAPAGPALAPDGRYPAETVKIGFETFTTTDEQFLGIQAYMEELQKTFNIEILYSEALDSAEGELAFIEQCGAAGCKAVIGYYNVSNEEVIKKCEELGMYYWGNGNNTAIVEYGNTSDYYLGSFYVGNADYEYGYGCVKALADQGCKKIILVSGGASFGVEMFIDRAQGATDAAKELGLEIVYEVPGWPGTEEFSAHQTNALATDADGIASMLTALMWIQPLNTAGKFGSVKVAAVDALNETVVEMFGAGMYVGAASEITEVFGMSIPMILNAVAGHPARNEDGTAPLVDATWWMVTSVEDAGYYASVQGGENGWAIEAKDIQTLLYDYNPDTTIQDMSAMYCAMTPAEIQARKG